MNKKSLLLRRINSFCEFIEAAFKRSSAVSIPTIYLIALIESGFIKTTP